VGGGGETSGGSEKSHYNASIADIAAEMENDYRERVMKLAQAHGVSTKTVHAALSASRGIKLLYFRNEEGASQDARGGHCNGGRNP
jgi:hypothetical protein